MPIYSYAELKGKIKVGDRVKDNEGYSGKVDLLDDRGFFFEDEYGICVFRGWNVEGAAELLTEEKTLDTVDVGDVVVDRDGRERTILDKSPNGTVLFLSHVDTSNWVGTLYTRQELKDRGFTVKQPTPEPKEMTLEEVSKALGYPVKIVE